MRRLWCFLLAATVLPAAVSLGSTSAGGASRLPVPHLAAGSLAEFSWDAVEPADADETELVLSLDGGRTFPLRVTGNLSLTTHRMTWRVPALAAGHARLALRAGAGEKPERETILFVGEEFAIDVEAGAGLEELFRVRGEWRTRDAVAGPESPFETALDGSPPEQMEPVAASAPAAEPPRPVAVAGAIPPPRTPADISAALSLVAPPPDVRRPLSVPLRS